MDLTRRPDDPDLRLLHRDAVRRHRWLRRGNVVVAAVIGALALANVVVIAGPVLGVASVGRVTGVDVAGFDLLGRDRSAAPAGTSALPRIDDLSEGGERSAGSVPGGAEGASALPTWTGPATPVEPDGEATAAPTSATSASTPLAATGTATPDAGNVAGTDSSTTPPSDGPTQSAGPPSGLLQDVFELVNAERAAAGCPALTIDDRLTEAADAHAADMVDRQYFDHTSPDGSTPSSRAAAAGYPGSVAENIATGYSAAAAVVDGWMDSPEHRANILDCDRRVTGIGQDPGSMPGYAAGTWVQVFG
ncbi:MAG: CAP domain-containing protein [Kineosporiaceae bacterium]